jgi:hypothetical protein
MRRLLSQFGGGKEEEEEEEEGGGVSTILPFTSVRSKLDSSSSSMYV